MEILSNESLFAQFLFENYWIVVMLLLWMIPWKGAALWRAARRNHLGWFIVLLLINTFGILEIFYLLKWSSKKREEPHDSQSLKIEVQDQNE